MSKTDKTLPDRLWKNPKFARHIPDGHKVKTLTHSGGFMSSPLIWGAEPTTLEQRPRGLKTERGINCDSRRTEPYIRAADVLAVQRALSAAGWPVLQDGVYGGYTERAVRRFQCANGLAEDGVVGALTERRLGL